MAEIDPVGRRLKNDFVQADDIAFPERSDFDFVRMSTGLANNVLDGDGST